MYLGSDNYLGPTAYLGASDGDLDELDAESAIEWDGIVLRDEPGEDYVLEDVLGWEDLPATRVTSLARPGQHGSFDVPVLAGPRTVVASGHSLDDARRDELLLQLQRSMRLGGLASELRIKNAGRTLSAAARLTRFRPSLALWPTGVVRWEIEWVCADPYRYGPLQQRYTTLPELVGGLEFDLFTGGSEDTGTLEFGERGSTGRVTLTNEGTADAWPAFEVRGPAPGGFTIQDVATGRRIVSTTVIPAGSSVRVNAANGMATLDGVDRSGQLTVREWTSVPGGGTATFGFIAPVFTSAALVASIRSTYW